jgi:hypothetical protein
MSRESEVEGTRELLVFGTKTFKVQVPTKAKLTFAPFSPPSKTDGYARRPDNAVGTLRVYEGTNIIAVFSGVSGYRDTSLGYMEEVAREEGATIWKDDEKGYMREEKVQRRREWVTPEVPLLGAGEEDKQDDEASPF